MLLGMRRLLFVMLSLGAILILALAPVAGCREGGATRPTGPEWTCSYQEITCLSGGCCPLASVCGGPDPAGFTRCEPGYCCAGPDPLWGAGRDGGTSDAGEVLRPIGRMRK